MRRVITVSSGKGGVGKTTFAINFALTLSRVAPTVLIDLDTGTSSVRNTLDAPVTRDLYHFFRKGLPLAECVTRLPANLDPAGLFQQFGFIAAPKHAMEDITNLAEEARWRLVHAVNQLPATYIVLDLRAGLDANVLDFLPLSNSGVLVFTPHHPAATLAAGDIVKSLLFRKLRFVFAPDSPFFRGSARAHEHRLVNDLLDQVEDVYEERLPNLDSFLSDLSESLGDNPYLPAIADVLNSFGVYFVLNMFNGVEESYDKAVRPFIEYLTRYVSGRLHLTNLGWVVEDDLVHQANCERRPILLKPIDGRGPRSLDPVIEELQRLESATLGLPRLAGRRALQDGRDDEVAMLGPQANLNRQLDILHRMYRSVGAMQVRDNFAYIAHRALHVTRYLPADTFGQARLTTPLEIFQQLFPRGR